MSSKELLIGCDFSSRPDHRKPIVIARGRLQDPSTVVLDSIDTLNSPQAFAQWLVREPQWLGAFDFPFGLPRELVIAQAWPTVWVDTMRLYASLSRADIRDRFAAFCARRPVGGKFAHRATDRWAGSSPSMKWVNPPVAFMLHAGVPALIDAGVCLPGLHPGDPDDVDAQGRPRRVGLEAYPGFKSTLVNALENGQAPLLQGEGLRLKLTHAQRDALADDASGDTLDAVLCLLQAAWGARQGWPDFGLPMPIDPLEGWIVTALPSPAS